MAIFTHDCTDPNCCKYAGSFNDSDVYMSRGGTLIIRFGNDGPDYSSYPSEIVSMIAEREPKVRLAMKLVKFSEDMAIIRDVRSILIKKAQGETP